MSKNSGVEKFIQWKDFKKGVWCDAPNVRDFIQKNYTPYTKDASFLSGPSKTTIALWDKIKELLKKEKDNGGVLDFDSSVVSSIDAYDAGYIDKELEKIVGLQTNEPLKRAYMPIGGIKMAQAAAANYGFKTNPELDKIYSKYRKTHNQAVFDVYTDQMRAARHTHVITGLPDTYARGRIIGDYRRIALYGIDFLIEDKKIMRDKLTGVTVNEETIRMREETAEQINALVAMKSMAKKYGCDISVPASNAREAIQWTYFGYLAAIKEQNGAAMSLGRVSTFFDIYLEKDIKANIITEEEAQELIDQFVMKLRIVRFIRPHAYNEIFSGDPVWATESIGGMGIDGRTLVTKTSYRFIHTLSNLGPSPEPNITILFSKNLPVEFKKFCARYSIKYSSIQYENDDLMRLVRGDDYGIACCVSAMSLGKEMQFFGARANLAKTLLYAINNGIDEMEPEYKMGPDLGPLKAGVLEYSVVWKRYTLYVDWLAKLYVNTLNMIHYMHDKYYYEAAEMALYDTQVRRFFATGIAGLSIVADSLSAIKFAKVTPVWEKTPNGKVAKSFKIVGDFPKFGNNDDRVDKIAEQVLENFIKSLRKNVSYRNSEITTSVLTITSNIMYGKVTGATPDGREAGKPFAPGANPVSGRDMTGAINSLSSVAKLNYDFARDGISNTWTVTPPSLGTNEKERENNLVTILNAYFGDKNGFHLNVNVLEQETLRDTQKHPENYPQLTIRVSGYAVNFVKLTKEQQDEVIARTFHNKL